MSVQNGVTSLMAGSTKGNVEVVKMCLVAGCGLEEADKVGMQHNLIYVV